MRIIFDVVHPAHVHFYRFMIEDLLAMGDEILVVSRPKDITTELLDRLEIPHQPIGSGPGQSRAAQAQELFSRVTAIASISRKFKPDVICCRNPAGAIASRLSWKTKSLFDTDDGKPAGLVYSLAYPFATLTTLPDCLPEETKRRHVGYPSYKSLAFTHPNRFTPDGSIRSKLGVGDNPYFMIRVVAHEAAHDHGEAGVTFTQLRTLVDLLKDRGRVFISTERELPSEFSEFIFTAGSELFHDTLAFAELTIGDSSSVPLESALLGTPSIFISSFANRLEPTNEIEKNYSLIEQFKPSDWDAALAAADAASSDLPSTRERGRVGRQKMLETKVDLSTWYVDLIKSFG